MEGDLEVLKGAMTARPRKYAVTRATFYQGLIRGARGRTNAPAPKLSRNLRRTQFLLNRASTDKPSLLCSNLGPHRFDRASVCLILVGHLFLVTCS